MELQIEHQKGLTTGGDLVYIIKDKNDAARVLSNNKQIEYVASRLKRECEITWINNCEQHLFFVWHKPLENSSDQKEYYRQKGFELSKMLKAEPVRSIQLASAMQAPENLLALAEGLALSSYEFLKYKTDKSSKNLHTIGVCLPETGPGVVREFANLIEAVFIARDLVNEPLIHLGAERLGSVIEELGKEAGFETEIFNKNKIQSLKMGGLLAVNAGSIDPPVFITMEYKHEKAVNSRPIVLVGKGVVYDTGGLSLKPTPGSMDSMKCDMAGAAAVAAVFYAAAKNQLPLHLIGYIPATDNRPGQNAITPGDIITIHDGTTVEVLNTDAEGRLILADALSYAAHCQPHIVIDLATLTGSAARATGKEGIVFMGTAGENETEMLRQAGFSSYERLVELPLWDEYQSYIKSEVADLKNIGGADAGAITAGMFLKHFVSYPWLHLDIAGPAFLETEWKYYGKQGTGIGVRLLYNFLRQMAG